MQCCPENRLWNLQLDFERSKHRFKRHLAGEFFLYQLSAKANLNAKNQAKKWRISLERTVFLMSTSEDVDMKKTVCDDDHLISSYEELKNWYNSWRYYSSGLPVHETFSVSIKYKIQKKKTIFRIHLICILQAFNVVCIT